MLDFVNRNEELDGLRDSFFQIVGAQQGCVSYIIRGRRGIGKTRLIDEFISRMETDTGLGNLPKFKKFKKEKHVMQYTCLKDEDEPFEPFIYQKASSDISQSKTLFRFLKIVFRVITIAIKVVVGSALVEDMKQLGVEVKKRASDDSIHKKEIKIYNKYLKMLQKVSRKAPLILIIRNIQWVDTYSTELIKMIIEIENAMFGMIILEEAGTYTHEHVKETLYRLIEKNRLQEMRLKPLTRESISRILKNECGRELFTQNEYNNIYSSTYGCPGLLESSINYWQAQNWIYDGGDEKWEKVENFNEKITPDYETFFGFVLDKFNSPPNPGDINQNQMNKIIDYANKRNVDESTAMRMTHIISQTLTKGYEISYRIGKGVFSGDIYLAKKDNRNYTVEYIQNVPGEDYTIELAEMEDIDAKIYRPKDFIRFESDILIIYPYVDAQQSQEFTKDQIINRNREVLDISLQVAQALAELHINNVVHGHLRPESIMITEGKKIHLAITLNPNMYRLIRDNDPEKYAELVSYYSPEHLKNQPIDYRTDIFLFGTVMYELLTGKRLFEGKDIDAIENQIANIDNEIGKRKNDVIHLEYWHILKKCLKQEPDLRYQSITELERELQGFKENNIPRLNGKTEKKPLASQANGGIKDTLKKVLIPLAAVIVIAIIGIKIFQLQETDCSSLQVIPGTIVIEPFDIKNTSGQLNPLSSSMHNYLLTDTIQRSSKINVLSRSQFVLSHNDKKSVAALTVSGDIEVKPIGYEITYLLAPPCKESLKITQRFNDPSALVKDKIKEIAAAIYGRFSRKEAEVKSLTGNWNAFEGFFKGEEEWRKLKPTGARQKYESALVYDNGFILAKLRLAEVYRFTGRNVAAIELIDQITPHLDELSKLDALKARALEARLKGKNIEEINILTEIFEQFPTRKESAYDVAEAYYELCGVERAIYYYKRSLQIDDGFEKAHNHLAYCYSHLGEHKKAIHHFNASLKIHETANAYDSLGDGYMAAGELEQAENAKKAGIRLDNRLSYLYGSLGFINIRQGKLREARENILKYIELANGTDRNAEGQFRLAYACYVRKDFETALKHCLDGLASYDSNDIVTRNHDLHWLLGLLYFHLDQPEKGNREIKLMERLIEEHKINATNYRQKIYKNLLHLEAVKASRTGHYEDILNIIEEFDGPIKDKIKDHGSPFDLAFFNTAFAKLLMASPIARTAAAQQRLKKALQYNPNFALAHYHLWQLYGKDGSNKTSRHHRQKFEILWHEADPDLKVAYGIGE